MTILERVLNKEVGSKSNPVYILDFFELEKEVEMKRAKLIRMGRFSGNKIFLSTHRVSYGGKCVIFYVD